MHSEKTLQSVYKWGHPYVDFNYFLLFSLIELREIRDFVAPLCNTFTIFMLVAQQFPELVHCVFHVILLA